MQRNFFRRPLIQDINTIMFCIKVNTFGVKSKFQKLCLLSESTKFSIFTIMPKLFIISTKSNSCHFNLEMIKEVSPVISEFIRANPTEMHYHLNIEDEENFLVKFEQLFQGETVIFEEDEIPSSHRITKMLQIKN